MTDGPSGPIYEPDVTGEGVCVDDVAFLLADAPFALRRLEQLAEDTIRQPDEIWSEWSDVPLAGIDTLFQPQGPVTIRRYIARFRIEGQIICLTALTETDAGGWRVREVIEGDATAHAARAGVLCYRRG